MNRRQMQRMVDRYQRIQELESELERRKRKSRIGNTLVLVSLIVAAVFVWIFAVRVTPAQVDGGVSDVPDVVALEQRHMDKLDRRYNESMENGFCLFGTIQDDRVVVDQVEYVDNPLSQSSHAMTFTCLPQLSVRAEPLAAVEDYQFLGAIHTHSRYAALSPRDRKTFDTVEDLVAVFGVYDGEELAMYREPYSTSGMELRISS